MNEKLTNRMDEYFKSIAEQVNDTCNMEYFLFIWRTGR